MFSLNCRKVLEPPVQTSKRRLVLPLKGLFQQMRIDGRNTDCISVALRQNLSQLLRGPPGARRDVPPVSASRRHKRSATN